MKVIIVGSGMAGLTAAVELQRLFHDVVVLDKGRIPGGRMSTRDMGGVRFDHGAQHFSVRTDAFAERVAEWRATGIVGVWYEGRSVTRPDHATEPRHVGTGGMRVIPVHIAEALDVRQSIAVSQFGFTDGGVTVDATASSSGNDHGLEIQGDAIILTPPVPQTMALLERSGVALPDDVVARLAPVTYDASLTAMASLDGPSGLPDGHRAIPEGPVAWIADNQHKGVSPNPSLTIHSSAAFADRHLDDGREVWVPILAEATEAEIDASITEAVGHSWRYSQPRTTLDVGAILLGTPAPTVLAGEVFAGAKVEGAFTSGLAAARLLVG